LCQNMPASWGTCHSFIVVCPEWTREGLGWGGGIAYKDWPPWDISRCIAPLSPSAVAPSHGLSFGSKNTDGCWATASLSVHCSALICTAVAAASVPRIVLPGGADDTQMMRQGTGLCDSSTPNAISVSSHGVERLAGKTKSCVRMHPPEVWPPVAHAFHGGRWWACATA
jgi:hypothetical protein